MARRFVQRSLSLEPQCAGRNAKGCANRQGYYDGGLQQRFQRAIPHRLLRGNYLAKDACPVPATTDVVAHSSTRNPHWRIFTFLHDTSNVVYIAIIGLAIAWCLWTGYYRPRKNHKKYGKEKEPKKRRQQLRLENEESE